MPLKGNNLTVFGMVAAAWLSLSAAAGAQVDETDKGESSFSFEASAGVEYDSNVSVIDLDVSTAADDFAGVIDAGFEFETELGQGTEIELSYDFSQSLHGEFTEFDIQSHRGSVGIDHDFGKLSAGATYIFANATLGGDGFLTLQQISPFVSGFLGKTVFVRAAYEFRDKNFKNRTDRDAKVHAGGVDVFFFIDGVRTYILGGYKYEAENTVADRFDFQGHNFKLRFVKRLPFRGHDAKFELGWRYEKRDYRSITPAIGKVRNDNRHKVKAELEIPVMDHVYVLVEYEYSDFSSNLPSADYTQNFAGVRVGVEF